MLLDTMVVTSRVWSSVGFCMWVAALCLWQIRLCSGWCDRDYYDETHVQCNLHMYRKHENNTAYFCNHKYISHLRLTLNDDVTFHPDMLPLDHIHGLKELVVELDGDDAEMGLLPTSDLVIDYNATRSPHPLALLERLEIHIPLRKIDPALFKHMERLKYLNLSHTLGLKASEIRHVLQNLSHAGNALEYLDLSWSRCFPKMQPDLINIREDVLRNLATFPLKFLDLRGIEFIEVDIGFAEFTPGLETLRIGEYQGPVDNTEIEYCIWLDISILPNITEIVFGMGLRENYDERCPTPWLAVEGIDVHVNDTSEHCLKFDHPGVHHECKLPKCECYKKINSPSLLREYKQNIRYQPHSDCPDYPHTGFSPFPLPLQLRYLSISETEMQARGWASGHLQLNVSVTHLEYRSQTKQDESILDMFIRGESLVCNLDLTYLDLQINVFPFCFISVLWNYLPKLEILHVEIHDISTCEWNVSSHPNLQRLNLSGCSASALPDLTGLTKLEYLDLSHNEIYGYSDREGSPLTKLTKLKHLDLSHNDLRSLPHHMTTFLDSLQGQDGWSRVDLDLSQNHLECACYNQEFFRWMRNTHVRLSNKRDLTCHHPLRGTVNLWDIDPVELRRYCNNFHHIVPSVVSGLGSICVVLIILLLVRKRWTIRYWLHAARTSWRRKQASNANCRHNYRYDAFVAYCSRDEDERKWVHLTLPPKLEQEYGFRLCLHHRDFTPGNDIADNIVEAIEDSNKVLLILSPAFLQSDWCQFEVRMAREKLVKDRRDSLVLVIYKPLDVPGVRLPRKLIRILEKKTYVEWTTDDAGQDLFWDKLSRALKDETHHEPYDMDLTNAAPSGNGTDLINVASPCNDTDMVNVAPSDNEETNQDCQLLMA